MGKKNENTLTQILGMIFWLALFVAFIGSLSPSLLPLFWVQLATYYVLFWLAICVVVFLMTILFGITIFSVGSVLAWWWSR